jgi:SSS family solute:Na+ symporter
MGSKTPGRLRPVTSISWTVVGAFLALTFGIGLWFARRAGRSTEEYFLSGRSLPWWIVGTSMVITTFAPDTPLGVAENVRTGVSYGWFGWNMVMGQMLAVFLFARLWRRSGVMTDNELLELRYSGRAAAGLRLFKALHFSILYNLIILSLILRAMIDVIVEVAGFTQDQEIMLGWVLAGTALTYAVLAGFWGVVATDFLQFWVAVGGTMTFAWMASDQFGGTEAVAQVTGGDVLSFFPDDPDHQLKILVYMTIMWWGIYNADGGGYLCQRMLAAKDERHATLGTLWFSVAYAAIRMWPWVLVGTMSLLVFPTVVPRSDGAVIINGRPGETVSGTVVLIGETVSGGTSSRQEEVRDLPVRVETKGGLRRVMTEGGEEVRPVQSKAYPGMMHRVLDEHPVLLGILVAAFLAAFLSTVDTHLNWGASYIVHDVLRRFVAPNASEKTLVWTGKGTVVVIMGGAVICSQFFTSIKDAWIFTWAVSAGIGPVLILRWFWWRVNAWAEIAALAVSILVAIGFEVCNRVWAPDAPFASPKTWVGPYVLELWHKALLVVGLSILAAIAAVLFAPRTDPDRLDAFVRRVRPPGFWGPVRSRVGATFAPDRSIPQILFLWVCGVAVVYGITFAIGGWIYNRGDLVVVSVSASAVGSVFLWSQLRR